MRGLFHLHTKYSYDGELSLKELVRTLPEADFLIITEHSETMNSNKYAKLVKECAKISKKTNKTLIPGIEFNTNEGYHVCGIFIKKFFSQTTAKKTIQNIKSQGGISVFSHPHKHQNIEFDKLRGVDMVEIWNRVYDGKYVLDPKNLRVMEKLEAKPVVALDFHNEKQKTGLYLRVKNKNLKNALEKGEYELLKNGKRISLEPSSWVKFKRKLYETARKILLRLQ